VTVIDTSGVVDLLIGGPASPIVAELLARERELAAPDILVFEVLSMIRRGAGRRALSEARAAAAVEDIAALPVRLFPSMPLRSRVWQLRENLTPADGLFVALAERLGEPLATKDSSLLRAIASLPAVDARTIALI
jgi:predicted nucleic acid-binding protein